MTLNSTQFFSLRPLYEICNVKTYPSNQRLHDVILVTNMQHTSFGHISLMVEPLADVTADEVVVRSEASFGMTIKFVCENRRSNSRVKMRQTKSMLLSRCSRRLLLVTYVLWKPSVTLFHLPEVCYGCARSGQVSCSLESSDENFMSTDCRLL
jgi:hypothetical protein